MPNYIPYLALILLSVLFFIFSWLKAKSKNLIVLYLTTAGLIYLFEYVVLVLFKAYEYTPGIFKDQYFDNIFGANVSDGFILPSLVCFCAIYGLSFWWVIVIILGFCGIESIFLHLHVYRHIWWKTIYTGLSLPIVFFLGRRLWHLICYNSQRLLLRAVILYFTVVSIKGTIIFYYAASFHLLIYHVGWYNDQSRDHIAFVTLWIFIKALFYVLVILFSKQWIWKVLLIMGDFSSYLILYHLKILEVLGIWVIPLLTVTEIVLLLILLNFNKHLDTVSED